MFLCGFWLWIELRELNKERKYERKKSFLSDKEIQRVEYSVHL